MDRRGHCYRRALRGSLFLGLVLFCSQDALAQLAVPYATPSRKDSEQKLAEDANDFGTTPAEVSLKPTMFYTAALSPDEAWMAIGTSDWNRPGDLWLYINSGQGDKIKPSRRLGRRFGLGVRTVAFSPDNRWVAAGSFTNEVCVLELKTLQTVAFWAPHTSAVNDLAFSSDGNLLATASLDKTVCVWELTRPEMASAGLPLRAKLEGHTEPVSTVDFAPDGASLLSGGRDRRVIVWDLESKAMRSSWDNLPAQVEHLAIAPNGETVAVGLWNGKVEVRSRADGAVLQTLDHLAKEAWTVGSVAFSPNSEQLASVATDGQLKLWSWKDGSLNKTIDAHPGQSWVVQYSADGTKVMTAGMEGTAKFWDLQTDKELFQLRPHEGLQETSVPVTAAAWSPNGAVLATSHADNSVRVRRIYNGNSFGEVRDLPETWTRMAFSPKNDQIAGAGDGTQLYLIDASPAAFARNGNSSATAPTSVLKPHSPITLSGHTGKVRQLAYAADGASIFSVSEDGTVRHWDALTGLPGPTRSPQQGPLHAVVCSADGRWLAAGGQSGQILLWDLRTAKLQPSATLSGHAGAILALAFSARNQLASSGEDKSLRLWDLKLGSDEEPSPQLAESPSKLLTGQAQALTRLAFSPVGGWLVADGPEKITRLWHTDSGTPGPQFSATSGVLALAFNPDGLRLLRVGDDGSGQYWTGTLPKIKPLATLNLADGVRFIAFAPDQSTVLIGTLTATVHAWDLKTGKIAQGHLQEGIADGALSADGKTLATIGFSGDVALWTPQPLKVVATMKRPPDVKTAENEGTAIAISADGSRLATGSWDGTIALWDVAARKELARLPKQDLPITGLRFSPDGTLLASTTGSWKEWKKPGTIKLWQVESRMELASLPGPKTQMRRAVFSRDGKTLVAGGSSNELFFFNVEDRKPMPGFFVIGDVAAVEFVGPSFDALAVGSAGGDVVLMRNSPRQLREYEGHRVPKPEPVGAIAVSPDGSVFVTGTSGGEIHVYGVLDAPTDSLAKRPFPKPAGAPQR